MLCSLSPQSRAAGCTRPPRRPLAAVAPAVLEAAGGGVAAIHPAVRAADKAGGLGSGDLPLRGEACGQPWRPPPAPGPCSALRFPPASGGGRPSALQSVYPCAHEGSVDAVSLTPGPGPPLLCIELAASWAHALPDMSWHSTHQLRLVVGSCKTRHKTRPLSSSSMLRNRL